jgi:dihydrofolate reductase
MSSGGRAGPSRMTTRLVLKLSISLDGYIAGPGNSSDFMLAGRSEEGAAWVAETIAGATAHLIGAATYSAWTGFWPSQSGPIADALNRTPKVVFSNSLTSAGWGETEIAQGDLAASIARLQRERAGDYLLAHGGVRLARSLVQTGLVDEYRLVVHPVVLGAGARLFDAPLEVDPVETIAFRTGAVAHVLRPR